MKRALINISRNLTLFSLKNSSELSAISGGGLVVDVGPLSMATAKGVWRKAKKFCIQFLVHMLQTYIFYSLLLEQG